MNSKKQESEYTIYEFTPINSFTGEELKLSDIISDDEYGFNCNAQVKWWESEAITLKTLPEIEARLKHNPHKDSLLMFDGPANSVGETHSDNSYRIANNKFQHVRQVEHSICGSPKKIFQLVVKILCPDEIDSPISYEAVRYAISQLPFPLNTASWVYQFHETTGIDNNKRFIKLLLFGITDVAITNIQKKEWLNQNGNRVKFDLSIYNRIRGIYTKFPKYKYGESDPFHMGSKTISRVGIVHGKHDVIWAEIIATNPIFPKISSLPVSKEEKDSYRIAVKNTLKLFEKNRCKEFVQVATKNIVQLNSNKLDKNKAVKEIQIAAETAMNNGKLDRIVNQPYLTDEYLLDLINNSINEGFGVELIEIPTPEKYQSKSAQFDWVMKQNDYKTIPVQNFAYTALALSFGLVGMNFSHNEIRDRIFMTHKVPYKAEKWMRERANGRMEYIVNEVMPSIDITIKGQRKVTYKEIESLEEVPFDDGVITLIKAGMGSGKTSIVGVNACNYFKGEALGISHRRTLIRSLSETLKLKHYMDDKDETNKKGFAVCIDSIAKAKSSRIFPKVLIIDEISQVLDTIVTSDVMKQKHHVYELLGEFIESTGCVIGLDAGICDQTINTIQRLTDKKIKLYEKYEEETGIEVDILSDFKNKKSILLNLAKIRNEPFVLCSDDKAYIKSAHDYFKEQGKKGICITGDNKNLEFMKDPKKYIEKHKPEYLAYSPAISSGVSIEANHPGSDDLYFQHIYCMYGGTILPADIIQMIGRVRNVKKITLVVLRGRSSSKSDEKAKENGLIELSGISKTRIRKDNFTQQVLESTHYQNIQRNALAITLYELMLLKQWKITFINNNQDNNELNDRIKSIAKTNKENLITNLIKAKLLEKNILEELSKKESPDESEQLEIIKGFLCGLAGGKEILDKKDIIYLKRFGTKLNNLRLVLGNEPQQELKDFFKFKKQFGREIPVKDIHFRRTTHQLAHKLLTAAEVKLETKNYILKINIQALATEIMEHRDICLALGMIKNIPKGLKKPSNLTRSFFGWLGLIQSKTRDKDEYFINEETFLQAMGYINNKDNSQVSKTIWPIKKSKRHKQLDETIMKYRYVMLTNQWIIDHVKTVMTKDSAKDWIKAIKPFAEENYHYYQIKCKYKGNESLKTIYTFIDEEEDLRNLLFRPHLIRNP